MVDLSNLSTQQILGQLLIGLINGSFYAMLSLGLALIFGILNIVNFAHGAFYMLGAIGAWVLLEYLGIGYWPALLLSPVAVGAVGIVAEGVLLRRVYKLDPMYGLLITLGLALVIEGLVRQQWGTAGQTYSIPPELTGGLDIGFMFLPNYRGWVIVASSLLCLGTWLLVERTKLGACLRATTENPLMVRAFGINVPRLITLTFGAGVTLAAVGGVMAAPIYQVSPLMGSNLIIVVFAVVVIGGMGSILGAVLTGFGIGVVEGLTKIFYPEASATIIFVLMAVVLMLMPAGLFGRAGVVAVAPAQARPARGGGGSRALVVGVVLLAIAVAAPLVGVYPGFLMKAMCFALFACAFNLLTGYAGLLSFGHSAFFGLAAYFTGYAMKAWGGTPELGLLIGTATGAVLGLVFGVLAIRREGIYFSMITLALSQMVYFFCVQARFTGGEDAMRDIPRGRLLGLLDLNRPFILYFFVLGTLVFGFLVVYRTIHSPFGQVLRAIRENEPRAISLGYNTSRCKLIAFVISAALTGLAGSMNSLAFGIAALSDVHWSVSGDVVLMLLLGGLGTVYGPVIGAIVLVGTSGYLAALGSWVTVIQGAVFIACVLLFRRGIMGAFEESVGRLVHKVRAPGRGSPTLDPADGYKPRSP